jgi:sarcosine oxidase/L-pipecolate oxidase
MLTRTDKSERIVIVGAGCFGLSTAYHLLKRGYVNVTVIDRAERIPADDAASSDLNKGRSLSSAPYNDPVLQDRGLLCVPPFLRALISWLLVVRSSYQESFYATLAQNAIDKWLNDDDWKGIYHE